MQPTWKRKEKEKERKEKKTHSVAELRPSPAGSFVCRAAHCHDVDFTIYDMIPSTPSLPTFMSGQPWRDSLGLLIASLCSLFHHPFFHRHRLTAFLFFSPSLVFFLFQVAYPYPAVPSKPCSPPSESCHHPSLHFPVMSGPVAPCLFLSACRGEAIPPPRCASPSPVFLASMPSLLPQTELPPRCMFACVRTAG